MTIAAFLVAMVGPLLARILTSLGLTLITLTGLVATTAALKTTLTGSLAGWPLVALQLGGLLGLWTCLGMVFGAFTFVITWRSTQGFIALAKA